MAESQRSDDRSQARSEAAALLGIDIANPSPADSLRIDMVSSLRLVIDHEQASVLSGSSADLGKLNIAVQSLIALLPGRELPSPSDNHPDPRQVMFKIYMEMRSRGEVPPEGWHQHVAFGTLAGRHDVTRRRHSPASETCCTTSYGAAPGIVQLSDCSTGACRGCECNVIMLQNRF